MKKEWFCELTQVNFEGKKFLAPKAYTELLEYYYGKDFMIPPPPEKRTDEYYKKRPCKELVGMAAEILDKYISENPYTT